ncbi:MAG: hypothetical protein HRU46_15330 [Verrucomicrobiales bacterium]|nr:hypothetical protein [Verrucomicrobiales bacterium]
MRLATTIATLLVIGYALSSENQNSLSDFVSRDVRLIGSSKNCSKGSQAYILVSTVEIRPDPFGDWQSKKLPNPSRVAIRSMKRWPETLENKILIMEGVLVQETESAEMLKAFLKDADLKVDEADWEDQIKYYFLESYTWAESESRGEQDSARQPEKRRESIDATDSNP